MMVPLLAEAYKTINIRANIFFIKDDKTNNINVNQVLLVPGKVIFKVTLSIPHSHIVPLRKQHGEALL